MRLHVLVEGTSEEALLKTWLCRLLPGHRCKVYPHRGKGSIPRDSSAKPVPRREGLLDQLPAKLRSFGRELNPEIDRVVVLVDADNDPCEDLKNRLLSVLERCAPAPHAVFCIAIEELEAFYLGDERAIREAFPHAKLTKIREYEPDSIVGTWEIFQKVIGSPVEDKVGWAARMANHLAANREDLQRNRSLSFRYFCAALFRIAGEPASDR